MDLLFLGTSAGVPTKARNVSATAVIEASGSQWYLVDCGEGTQHRLLHTPLSIRDLRGIFITHVHGDHCFGLPGLLASSTIVSTSDVGRLSTTYQPRSSSTAAAAERPAPDNPVIRTMSATTAERIAYSFRVRRYRRRGMVAASRYSAARSRNPSGGAGSSIRSISRPFSARVLTYRLRGRWMNGMNTSFSTSSSLSCSTRYAPMRQYCSGGSSTWSSIHPLFGVCSSGWFRKNTNRPPRRSVPHRSAGDHLGVILCAPCRLVSRRGPRPARRLAAAIEDCDCPTARLSCCRRRPRDRRRQESGRRASRRSRVVVVAACGLEFREP